MWWCCPNFFLESKQRNYAHLCWCIIPSCTNRETGRFTWPWRTSHVGIALRPHHRHWRSFNHDRFHFHQYCTSLVLISWDSRADNSCRMAANTRYEQAPQRDSFEEREYSQPPPSYQATSDLPTAPRSEGDNLPDDFKVCSTWRLEGWVC